MKIVVRTEERLTDWALGRLFTNGEFQAWTRETTVFKSLPAGVFKVSIEPSEWFGQKVPRITGVPGLKHATIIPKMPRSQMDGDIMVGLYWNQAGVSGTTGGFNLVFDRIQRAVNDGEEVTLEIVR
jgi:hypothetical protein